jgi:hypothetical protein
LVAILGCRLERLPPPGSARDLEAIRTLVSHFHESLAAGDEARFQALFDPHATIVWNDHPARTALGFWEDVAAWSAMALPRRVEALPLRLEVRHAGGVATVWAASIWTVSRPGRDSETVEHRAVFLLQQQGEQWRIQSLVLRRRPVSGGA